MTVLSASSYRSDNGIAYLRVEPANGGGSIPIVLLHGFLQRPTLLEAAALRLARERNAPVLLPAAPGHGSDHRRFPTATSYLDALASDVGRADLVGYSMGGRMALWLSFLHPGIPLSLTLLSASPGYRDIADATARASKDDALAERIASMDTADFRSFVLEWNDVPIFAGRSLGEEQIIVRCQNPPIGVAACLSAFSSGRQPELSDHLRTSGTPTHYLAGEEDATYSAIADSLRGNLRDPSAVTVIAGAGHDLLAARPNATIDSIGAWLGALR